jgi:flagellar biosynthesis/type III secretory pathway protein FliH
MTIERACVVERSDAGASTADAATMTTFDGLRARRIAGEVLTAREEAARIVATAREEAAAIREAAAHDAREADAARLAVELLRLREAEARSAGTETDRVVEIALVLAERLVGEAIRIEPSRVAELAAAAIAEARGARRVRIDACPDDVAALRETLGAIGQAADIHPDETLGRGSLVVHTELGHVDGRLRPQLGELARAVREALR